MNKKGFTLIELLVVIAVLGILAAVVLVAINPTKRLQSARDSGIKSDIGQVATALETYYTANALYPIQATACDAGTCLASALVPSELKNIPTAPTGRLINCDGGTIAGTVAAQYRYRSNAAGTDAVIYCQLENPTATASPVYCYRTAAGKATEMAAASCTP